MQATLTELQRQTRQVVQRVIRAGEEVILTDGGRPVAKIVPYLPTKVFDDPEAMRQGLLTDDAILAAVREAREELAEQPNRTV